jgi:hypothetical protein
LAILGIINFVGSIKRRRKFNEERIEWVKTGGAIGGNLVPSQAAEN